MTLLFTYLLLALSVSFLCSILEAVLLSIPVSYIEVERRENPTNPMIKIKDSIDKPLSAILSLNTIAHTIGAAGVGAQAAIVFGDAYFGVVSAVLTVLILIFSEILPKSIGAHYWKDLVVFAAKTIRLMIWITYPLVFISEGFTKLFGGSKKETTVSRDELSVLVSIGAEEGVIDSSEQKMIDNFLAAKDKRVDEILTPRVVVVIAPASMTAKELLNDKKYSPYSRIPIYDQNPEEVNGYIYKSELFERYFHGETEFKLSDIKRDVIYATGSTVLASLWDQLINSKEHIAIVVDEYGEFEGVVTMEDVIETILGTEIVDERDTIVDMQEYAKEKFRLQRQNESDNFTQNY